MISSSQRPVPNNTQHSQHTNIHAPGGIRIHTLSRREASDPLLNTARPLHVFASLIFPSRFLYAYLISSYFLHVQVINFPGLYSTNISGTFLLCSALNPTITPLSLSLSLLLVQVFIQTFSHHQVRIMKIKECIPKHTQTVIDATQKEVAIDQQQHSCETLICQRHQTILRLLYSAATARTRWRVRELIPLTPNDLYISRTAPLTSKRCILYIYSTNVGTEYFKHVLCSPFFFLFKMQSVS